MTTVWGALPRNRAVTALLITASMARSIIVLGFSLQQFAFIGSNQGSSLGGASLAKAKAAQSLVGTGKLTTATTGVVGASSPRHSLYALLDDQSAQRNTRRPAGVVISTSELKHAPIKARGQEVGNGIYGVKSGTSHFPTVLAAVSDSAGSLDGGSCSLRGRLKAAPGIVAFDLRDDVRDRVHDIRESLVSMTDALNSDFLAPLTHLARNPSTIHYTAAMSARLSYFMAQQTVVSTTVERKLAVDPVTVARAVLAALAGGREEPIIEALRIPEERIMSTESYAWWSRNLKGIVALMKREAISIERGDYLLPYDMRLTEAMGLLRYNPAKMITGFTAYYKDELRRKKAMLNEKDPPTSKFFAPGRYPDYFLANEEDFLSARESRTMDYQMESKMWGMGDAMRRRSISRIGRALADKDPETASLLDVGCGTGRFLKFVKSNFPLLQVSALDLSLFNLRMAKRRLGHLKGVAFFESNAEHMAMEKESHDVVTCNFVLSNIPSEAQVPGMGGREARGGALSQPPDIVVSFESVINKMARVLKPGGKVIIVDANQPEFDGAGVCTVDGLPSWGDRTPAYRSYLKSDLEYNLIKAGLFVQEKEINWVSKVLIAQKPPRLTPPSNGRAMGVGA